jgi:hypothetical protein
VGATERFVGVRQWARRAGLPRWVFIRPRPDVKPGFVDLSSPMFTDLFCQSVRDSIADGQCEFVVTEMLPTFDQLWLADAGGGRYTSELRLVIFDPAE